MIKFSFVMPMAAVIAAISMTASAFSADVDKAIRGTWKGSTVESCQALINQTTDDYLIVGKKSFKRHEGECAIFKYSRKGKVHDIQFMCETEGEIVRDNMKITVLSGSKIAIAGSGQYERCK